MYDRVVKTPSPSRTYVVLASKGDFSGYYFRKFTLPQGVVEGVQFSDGTYAEGSYTHVLRNTHEVAAWYYLNHLNLTGMLDLTITWEDFSAPMKDQDHIVAQRAQEYLDFYKAA